MINDTTELQVTWHNIARSDYFMTWWAVNLRMTTTALTNKTAFKNTKHVNNHKMPIIANRLLSLQQTLDYIQAQNTMAKKNLASSKITRLICLEPYAMGLMLQIRNSHRTMEFSWNVVCGV